jgi:hypothetical protein
MTPQASEVLEKAPSLSAQERGLLVDRLIASLDDGPADESVEEAWADEIKLRVDEVLIGRQRVGELRGQECPRHMSKCTPLVQRFKKALSRAAELR